jgi:ADP-ribose pyrophosphatase YjhB (NUDIX family)
VRVKAHAIIWIDGLLIVARQAGCGRQAELTLPGGNVNAHESIADALKREVSQDTGLEIEPAPWSTCPRSASRLEPTTSS